MNFYVLIPAYRPDGKLLHLLESLHTAGLRKILVVNDGSGDAYEAVFEAIRERWSHIAILPHDANLGKGAALKTGFWGHALLTGRFRGEAVSEIV